MTSILLAIARGYVNEVDEANKVEVKSVKSDFGNVDELGEVELRSTMLVLEKLRSFGLTNVVVLDFCTPLSLLLDLFQFLPIDEEIYLGGSIEPKGGNVSFTKTKEFDNIKEIDGKRETLKLGVRINDLWHVNNRNGSKHLEMILMDDKGAWFPRFRVVKLPRSQGVGFRGDLISAVVKKEDLVVWESRLVKNETYVMHNFKILKNQPQYRVCDHDYKLIFIGATIVKVQPLPNIPMKLFNFKSIKQIKDGDFHAGILIDVIGIVHNVKNNPNSTSVVFDMFDLSGFAIGCTLWDSYATKFMDHWDGIDKSKGFVIILTQAKIKPASGPWPVSISNFWHGTKLLMDQDFPQIKEMKELLKQYKLDIQVCCGNDVANFILWDQECTNIIGKSVVELMEATEDDPKIFPKDLDVLLGVELAFKVRVQPQRRCASVIKTCDDAEIIRVIKDVLEENKCNLSGIGNNDPNVDTHATPSKRLLPMFDGENTPHRVNRSNVVLDQLNHILHRALLKRLFDIVDLTFSDSVSDYFSEIIELQDFSKKTVVIFLEGDSKGD
ncbi:hypothetical protein V8G54_034147 [Vigna mungo]|uniref:Replication protein A 70 kDa DNA-binding subunit B/D first OB fold domain-containing protein n=1 Tax=Vigna mungo TaxID=3915 RepID=A0AAQ3MQM3_VIGMU